MPNDQAAHLRLLVHDERQEEALDVPRAARALFVYGAKGGVGATTIVLDVAIALALAGRNVELTTSEALLRDDLSVVPGPAGTLIRDPRHWARLLAPLRLEREHDYLGEWEEAVEPEWLVIDAASAHVPPRRVAEQQQEIVMTTLEPASLLATLDFLKEANHFGFWPEVVLNRSGERGDAEGAGDRLKLVAKRAIGRELIVRYLPEDRQVPAACHAGQPASLRSPWSAYSRQLTQLVDTWSAPLSQRAA